MNQRIIDLYDEYTHGPLDRRVRFPWFFVFQRASFMLPVFPHADH